MSGLTAKEHEVKVDRFSGSTVGQYMGYSKWRSPAEAVAMNDGEIVWKDTDDTVAGNIMEPSIANLALERLQGQYGADTTGAYKPTSLFHPAHREACVVHCDLLLPAEKIGIQIKNHHPAVERTYNGKPGSSGQWDNDLVSDDYLLQCQLEMEVCRLNMADPDPKAWTTWLLGSYFGGSNLKLYWIKRDAFLLRGMMSASLAFWRKYLNPAGPRVRPVTAKWLVKPYEKPAPRLDKEALRRAPAPFDDDTQAQVPGLSFGVPFLP